VRAASNAAAFGSSTLPSAPGVVNELARVSAGGAGAPTSSTSMNADSAFTTLRTDRRAVSWIERSSKLSTVTAGCSAGAQITDSRKRVASSLPRFVSIR